MVAQPFIDPVAFELGPLAVRWYGISYVVGIGCAWWLLSLRAREPGAAFDVERTGDLVFQAALGGILGGRLGYVLFYDLGTYLAEPWRILAVWQGGMSFHGGVLGFIVAMVLAARGSGRGFFAVADHVVPVVPVGLFFGRLGNFVNGELWGKPTTLPWGVVFVDALPPGVPRHPTQLYEAALEGLLLFAILWPLSARPRRPGELCALFLIGYGLARSAVELLREPDAHIGYLAFGWLTMGQLLSLPMVLAGVVLLVRARHLVPRPGGAPA